jgi:tRNA (guanine37-N1)-methyltransferase
MKFVFLDQILRPILPDGVPSITSFETIGHIAHVNLRDQQLPFKHQIGEAILLVSECSFFFFFFFNSKNPTFHFFLKKNPKLKTVVNKVESINTEFRTAKLELLAGENNLETVVV